jgi:hypothetical protein
MVIFLQMTASVGILTYVFVAESSDKLPESFFDWRDVQFTREYWLCTAFPSKIQDPDRLYGFPACKLAVSFSPGLRNGDERKDDWKC